MNPKKLRPYDQPRRRRRSLIPDRPDSAGIGYLVTAALWLALAGALGLAAIAMGIVPFEYSLALGIFGLAIEVDAMRVEYAFVNATVFGWLTNAAFAAICFMTPRLVGRRLAMEKLLLLALPIWNGALFTGLVSMFFIDVAPHSPFTAMLWLFDGGLALGATVVTVAFLLTAATSLQSAYVSTWFAGVALLGLTGFVGLDALVGLIDVFVEIPEIWIGLGSAFIQRALPVMWLLGVTFAILHYVVPRAVGLPLASWGLALLTFLSWLALAPLTGLGEVVDGTIPYVVTTIGAVATMLLLVPVSLAVANLVMSMQGRWGLLFGAGPASLALVSMAFLLGSSVLAAIGALRTVDAFLGSSDWQLGLLMWMGYGAFTFAAFAIADHALPRMLRRAWRTTAIGTAQLWLVFAGTTIAGAALLGGGLAEASMVASSTPPDQLTASMLPYRASAFLGFAMTALGGLAHVLNIFMLYTTAEPEEYVLPGQAAPAAAGH